MPGNQTRALDKDGANWLRYEYDAANRPVNVRQGNGPNDGTLIESQQFGVGNERIALTNEVTNQKTWYGDAVEYAESNGSGTLSWSKTCVYLGDTLLSTVTPDGAGGETTEYNHPDRLGTKLVTNQAAGTNSEQSHLPFRKALDAESTLTTNPKRFTSYERSAGTELDYAVNRTYDSKQGRFTQVDPVGMEAVGLAAPQSLNLYTYCGNDPVNYLDPSGLFWGSLFKWIGKIFKAFSKILKWVVLAVVIITVAIAIVVSPEAAFIFAKAVLGLIGKIMGISVQSTPYVYSLATGALSGGVSVSMGISGYVIAGFYSVGSVSSFAQTRHGRKRQKKQPFVIGGTFSVGDLSTVKRIKSNVDTLLKDPNCAKVLGGTAKAQGLAKKATVMNGDTINPAFRGSGGTAARAAHADAMDPNSNTLAILEVPGRFIFLNHRFFDRGYSDAQLETVYIHELHRLGGLKGNSMSVIKGDYANIVQACGTASPYSTP